MCCLPSTLLHVHVQTILFLNFLRYFFFFLPISFLTLKIFSLILLFFNWIFLILHCWLFKKCFLLNIVFALGPPFVLFWILQLKRPREWSEILKSWSLQNTLWKLPVYISIKFNLIFSTSKYKFISFKFFFF